ncbi:YHS domain-containing protein [Candidatus Bathyarchaeota archaeon]|nr:YHS domain-containing protein [Candidatus Bathyarchaeota archaeon]
MIKIDPICNIPVDTDEEHPVCQRFKGKEFYFCSEKCRRRFNQACNTYCAWRARSLKGYRYLRNK